MKYIIVVLLFFLFSSSNLIAQKGILSVSFSNGLNNSGLRIMGQSTAFFAAKNTYAKQSYCYGIGVRYGILKKLRINVSCNFEEKGWKTRNGTVIDTISGNIIDGVGSNFSYPFISFPILLDYVISVKYLNIIIESGYLINTPINTGKVISNLANTIPIGFFVEGSPIDYGWGYGIGLEKHILGNIDITLISRYTRSHSIAGSYGVYRTDYRHHNFAILLQLFYKIKSK